MKQHHYHAIRDALARSIVDGHATEGAVDAFVRTLAERFHGFNEESFRQGVRSKVEDYTGTGRQ